MKNTILLLLLFSLIACQKQVTNLEPAASNDFTFQISTKQNLIDSEYYRNYSLKNYLTNGNFGIGTLNGVDGELIILDGIAYRVDYNGKVNRPELTKNIPFGNIKFFVADTTFFFSSDSLDKFKEKIQPLMKSEIAAIKVTGKFNFLKTRSVPKQPPHGKTLAEIIAVQNIFEFKNIEATLVGFYISDQLDKLNFPGFHLHSLLNDKTGGGHLLDCVFDSVQVQIDFSDGLKILF